MNYDIAVIGGGSAGLSVAAAAAQFGQKVVLFEKGKMGGDCLNYGCVPSKALIAAAKNAQAFRNAGKFGITASEPIVDFNAVMAHVKRVIAAIAPHDSQSRFEGLGVRVVRAQATFRDAVSLVAKGEIFKARRFVVATGSRAAAPPILGLDGVSYFTNETLFDNTVLPAHLVIIGGGPVGIEMAQAHRRLGSAVTVIEAVDALGKDDAELAAVVLARLRSEGVGIFTRCKVKAVRAAASGIAVETEAHGTVEGSHLLVAAGRLANIEGLNLQAAGIAFTPNGISVGPDLKTSNARVYAIGDVAGGPQFTHAASYQAGLVIRNALFGLPVRNRPETIPRVTYTDPELAQAGLTEAQARDRHGGTIKVLRSPFHDNDRAQTEAKTTGLIKVIAGRNGKILGAGIVGAEAGELIQPWVLAMASGLTLKALATAIQPYPTLGEVSHRVAVNYFSGLATNPWLRRVIWLVSRLG